MLKVLENLLLAWRRWAPIRPTAAERQEARKWPNGYLYRIDLRHDPNGRVPPEGIVGAWQVNAEGKIIGPFRRNENYRP